MRGKFRSYKLRDQQLRKKRRKPRKPLPLLWYKRDPSDPLQIILRNGTRIRCLEGEDVYVSIGGRVYTLTKRGLREIRVNFNRNNNYCKPTRNGCRQGRRYPYVKFRGKTYIIHVYMCKVWLGARPEGFETDHINGDIDDFRLLNLRYVSKEENVRCRRILNRLQSAAVKRNDPVLAPKQIAQKDLIEIFERLRGKDLDVFVPKEIERYRLLMTLRRSSVKLRDPQLNPDNMDAERRERVLSKYRIEDPEKIMEDDFKHHREF